MSERGLSIVALSDHGRTVITLSGELDRSTMLEFIETCNSDPAESIVIDLDGLTFMDGGGFSSLVVIREIAEASGRSVTVRNAHGQPARLMGLITDLEAAHASTAPQSEDRFLDLGLDAADEEAERRYSDLLAEFAQTMATDFPIQSILEHLVERIVEVLPVEGAGVTLTSPQGDPYEVTASNEAALRYAQLQRELGEGPCIAAYTEGSAISVPDLRDDGRFPTWARQTLAEGLGAAFAFPLRHEDRLLGALDLYRARPGVLSARQLDVAQTLANVAAAYLVNAEARADLVASTQQANHIALHDPLTGLPNRRLLFERLVMALHRCRRSRSLVALMYIDLDTFKVVNDTFGHRVGDEVLTVAAHRLTGLLRPGDTVARLGGDEFVLLCDDIPDASHVEPIADRVTDAFQVPFDVSTGPVQVRASIGVSIGDWTSTSPDRLLENADTAMYRAKRAGGGHHALLEEAANGPTNWHRLDDW